MEEVEARIARSNEAVDSLHRTARQSADGGVADVAAGMARQLEELADKVQGLERDVEERIEIKMQVGGVCRGGRRCEGCVWGAVRRVTGGVRMGFT